MIDKESEKIYFVKFQDRFIFNRDVMYNSRSGIKNGTNDLIKDKIPRPETYNALVSETESGILKEINRLQFKFSNSRAAIFEVALLTEILKTIKALYASNTLAYKIKPSEISKHLFDNGVLKLVEIEVKAKDY